MPAYHSIFDHNDSVNVIARDELVAYQAQRKWNVSDEQLKFGGQSAFVENVSYYHGGDVLYTLYQYKNERSGNTLFTTKLQLPGMWPEALVKERRPSWQYVHASSVLEVIASTIKGQPVIIVRNKHSGVEYLVSRQDLAERVANDMAVVFEARDAHMVALKYGFRLDFQAVPLGAI